MDRRYLPFNERKHGESKTRLFSIWTNMRKRCSYDGGPRYRNYGGRGIRVCDEWENDFLTFKNWAVNNGYDDTKTIDRIDVNGNYEPQNCRWVDRKDQYNNKRCSKWITYNGETKTVSQWCETLGLPVKRIRCRLERGWTPEQAFNKPLHARPNGRHDDVAKMKHVAQIDDIGYVIRVFDTVREAAETVGVYPANINAVCNGKRKHTAGYHWEYTTMRACEFFI